MRLLLLLVGLLPLSCATVIRPDAVRAANAPQGQIDAVLEQWQAAVDLVNAYLDEQPPAELPWFRLGWSEKGMLLVTDEGVRSFAVASTPWGWLVVQAGFTAQERSWGFVVGPTGQKGDPALQNSFFQGRLGQRGSHSLGGLILHEAAHTLQPSGTVSFLRGARYYWHAIWNGGGEAHPDEADAYRIERQFRDWADQRAVIRS